ncbi:hypothetical protein [Nonomuraea dietziae]
MLKRQLARMTSIDRLLAELPEGVSFDLLPGEDGAPPGRPRPSPRRSSR